MLSSFSGIPRQLADYRLGQRAMPNASPKADQWLPELCMAGRVAPRVGNDGQINRYLVIRNYCHQRTDAACEDLGRYADALAAAWGVPHRFEPARDGYRFITSDTEAVLEPNPEGIVLYIIDAGPDTICTSRDGFVEFHTSFLEAVDRADRDRVASFFSFPFDDEWRERVLRVQSHGEFLLRYHEFIAPKRSASYPHLVPTKNVVCRFEYNAYLDLGWREGGMAAQKRHGQWTWTKRFYVP